MAKVNKHTRASKDGKDITCPICKKKTRVYHFSWIAIQCLHCRNMVDKNKWSVSDSITKKK